jgi:predicted DNA-binding ribbon-helix-helix protein
MKRSADIYLLAHRPEEPHANQSDGHCRRPYWTAAAFVIGRTQRVFTGRPDRLLCVVGHHRLCYFCNAPKSFFDRHGAGRFFRLDVADLLQMGGAFMKSLVIKRSVVVAGHKTSVSLEDAFWKGLKDIARERQVTLSELVGTIDSEREYGNLSSVLRLFVLDFYCTQLSDLKEGRDGSDGESESSGAVRIRRVAQARH